MKSATAPERPPARKRILVLTFFYPPDLCAGSFRASALVDALRAVGGSDILVDVLTTHPNRYHSHRVQSADEEEVAGVRILRMTLPPHHSAFLDQARAFAAYARQATRLARRTQYDLVVATSSRLGTAVLGARISREQRAPLYLDIRDPFVETLAELLPWPLSAPLRWLFGKLEACALRRARRVNLVTEGLLGYFQPRYPARDFSLYTNGVDTAFAAAVVQASGPGGGGNDEPVKVLYAGNVGAGQGLHRILPGLARRLQGRVCFRVVGGGGQVEQLRQALEDAGVDNVELLEPVAREQLVGLYAWADVLFLHLSGLRAMRLVLPSKLFEYAATGKPIWAGASGYAAAFIRRELDNVALFEPCDVEGAVRSFSDLRPGTVARTGFAQRYRREDIMRRMAADVLALLEGERD